MYFYSIFFKNCVFFVILLRFRSVSTCFKRNAGYKCF